jgi:hypothetical protein
MSVKSIKHYERLFEFAKENFKAEKERTQTFFKRTLDYDYDAAADIWEYILVTHEKLIESAPAVLTQDILSLFMEANKTKTLKLVTENPLITKALYGVNPLACEGLTLEILVGYIAGTKTAEADELLKQVYKNTAVKKSFGENMKIIIERLFVVILSRLGNTTKRVELNKKQVVFLLGYIEKIKGPEKALLEQRIKELLK